MDKSHESVKGFPRSRAFSALVSMVGVGVLLLLSGCSGGPAAEVDFTESANDARIQKWIGGDGDDGLTWKDCEASTPSADGLDYTTVAAQCATLTVPVDWFAKDEETTQVGVLRVLSTGTAKGDLLLNPGGPGVGGVDLATSISVEPSAASLRENFNLVGFDPRGVASPLGVGDPLTCGAEAPEGCKPSKRLEHSASTAQVAHDMEYLRVLLGDAPLNYLGYSYGTYLGSIYATLFPASVGAMLLDGPAPDAGYSDEGQTAQAAAMAQTRKRFLRACVSGELGDCPFTGSAIDAEGQIAEWAKKYADEPLDLEDGIEFTEDSVDDFLTASWYGSRATWPAVAEILGKAKGGDTTSLTIIASASAEVDTKIVDAVVCPIAEEQEECDPQIVHDPKVNYVGTETLVVVANTGDPATLYSYADDFVAQLGNATLVSVNAEGHTAVYGSSTCASETATDYFVSGVIPTYGARCTADD